KDMGILASLDPVAVDQAGLDMVFNHQASPDDDEKPLIDRINSLHGTYITDYAEQIGLGSKSYILVNLDE
ncbi:MAG: ferredoxin, partial [Prevotellaceae bacterium]|nr:ferredoxin [Prevotellaceae bacterium]